MQTTMFWEKEEPKDWAEEFGRLPGESECERFQKGDELSFFIDLPDGSTQEYFVKVKKIDICLSWKANTTGWGFPVEVRQFVYLK